MRQHLNVTTSKKRINNHVEFGKKRIEKDESDVQAIMQGIVSWIPNIWSPNQPLINIYTGVPASTEIMSNFKTLEKRGSEARDEFISRFTDSSSSKKFLDPIHKLPSKTFGEKPKKKR